MRHVVHLLIHVGQSTGDKHHQPALTDWLHEIQLRRDAERNGALTAGVLHDWCRRGY